jgi:hypothetical protein
LSFVAVVIGCAGLAAALLAHVGFGGSERVQIGTGSISALARAARAGDALPGQVASTAFAARNFAHANGEGSRLLQNDGSLELYAVPGKGRMVCLIEVDDQAGTAGGACADRRVLLTSSIYTADRQEDGSWLVAGLVGDGHTFVAADGKRTGIRNNAFLLRGVEADEITIGSPTAEQTIDIGG